MKVQFLKPSINEKDIQAAVKVLRSGWLVLSQETKAFEKDFAAYMGTKEAVLTNSCTCSIHLLFVIAGLKAGDEVITTPLSYVSTANPILHCGATPVFVDVDPKTGLINPDLVEKAITKKTKAILPVHLYGQMADMKRLKKIADKHGLYIVEDAAHAIESSRDGVRPGQLSMGACFSFHTAKNLTAGQGGALITNDPEVATRARLLRRDGVKNIGVERRMTELGFKYLSTDFDAALLRSQLKRIDKMWKQRKALYDAYTKALDRMGVSYSGVVKGSKHAYHMIVIWVDPKKRPKILEGFAAAGVDVSIHYDPIHLEPYFRKRFGYKNGDFPVTERLGLSTITLPMYPGMKKTEQNYVLKVLEKNL